ncbi:hypothetical protein P8452_03900 [Trifolium repens]|nr:hypothetical protein P8452_03900 [Trifolium repens]
MSLVTTFYRFALQNALFGQGLIGGDLSLRQHASGRSHILPLLDAHTLFFPTHRPPFVWVRAGSFVALSRAGHYQKTKGGLARVR